MYKRESKKFSMILDARCERLGLGRYAMCTSVGVPLWTERSVDLGTHKKEEKKKKWKKKIFQG